MTRTELLVIAKLILFNAEMVRAILDNRKTVTRRVIKPPYFVDVDGTSPMIFRSAPKGSYVYRQVSAMPYPESPYRVGDILYVRETFYKHNCAENECIMNDYSDCNGCTHTENGYCYAYKASHEDDINISVKWKPSIHMPKEAARIFLRVTDVRVERLQDMNGKDLEKEGIKTEITHFKSPINNFGNVERYEEALMTFSKLWDSTVKKADIDKYGWDSNCWVYVYGFERVETV